MSEPVDSGHKSSSSSLSSSIQVPENEVTISTLLEQARKNGGGGLSERSLGQRLSHLDSIPHTPRVNGQIPDFNNAIADHDRLRERLSQYGLAEFQIEGDGNCQFRALADQVFRNPEHHRYIRREVVKQLKDFRENYEGYVPMDYKTYVKKMKRSGEWGDHITLQAAADRFCAKICLLTSFRDSCFVEIMPKHQTPVRELWLSFWSEVHYNSLYAVDDLPTQAGSSRRKHWHFPGVGSCYLFAAD